MSSPRPMAPSSSTPATSVMKRTQRVQWMQRVHVGADQRPEIFVLDRALVVLEAAGVEAVGHGLVLQIAFAALVADRAVERMIDEQEFEHAFARLLHRLGVGDDGGRRAVARGPEIVDAHGAGGDGLRHAGDLDQAHAAIAGDRQALVIAEARDLDAGELAGLDQGDAVRHVVLLAVDDELRHASCLLSGERFWRRSAAIGRLVSTSCRNAETSACIARGSRSSGSATTANRRDAGASWMRTAASHSLLGETRKISSLALRIVSTIHLVFLEQLDAAVDGAVLVVELRSFSVGSESFGLSKASRRVSRHSSLALARRSALRFSAICRCA